MSIWTQATLARTHDSACRHCNYQHRHAWIRSEGSGRELVRARATSQPPTALAWSSLRRGSAVVGRHSNDAPADPIDASQPPRSTGTFWTWVCGCVRGHDPGRSDRSVQ